MSKAPFPTSYRYAARLNSFKNKAGGETALPGVPGLLSRAASVPGLNAVDLNFPDHLEGNDLKELKRHLDGLGLSVNGFAMRYYGDPGFRIGAFTNPDARLRRLAVDQTKRGIDQMLELGGSLMTLWMGQDGFDYSFQADYARLWDQTLEAISEVADHVPGCEVSIEYKPNEPRSFALMPDIGTTLLAIREMGRSNVGVTIDFAHVLYADEMPAYAVAMAARSSRLFGVHLNDGYAKRDDGLMVGTVHPVQTLELLYVLEEIKYDRPIYFDTFPDTTGLDPVEECKANIATVEAMRDVVRRLQADNRLRQAVAGQDAVASSNIVREALYGPRTAR
ncbi:MAG: TIM barrel protein [Rhizobiales bacterium]|nr:TIM barrel protein [Hyphomicrobiales bacterium]